MPEGALGLVAEVARALGDLRERVVFIGGAVAGLLHEDSPFGAPRPTTDGDAIAITAGYADFGRLGEELRARGFREMHGGPHAHRWISPGPRSVPFDLVPLGDHLGASGNVWDAVAVETAAAREVDRGVTIRHVSAPGFLALKLAAFRDRGSHDPLCSTDLEDIFSLLAARPGIVDEVAAAPHPLRAFIARRLREVREIEFWEDLLVGHLGSVDRSRARHTIPEVERRFHRLAEL